MLFDYKDQLKTGECCLHMWSSFPGMSGARATVFFCVFSPHHRNRACPAFSIAFQGVVGRMYWCCRNSVLAVPVLLLLCTVMAPRALLKLRPCFTWHCTHDIKGCCCPYRYHVYFGRERSGKWSDPLRAMQWPLTELEAILCSAFWTKATAD